MSSEPRVRATVMARSTGHIIIFFFFIKSRLLTSMPHRQSWFHGTYRYDQLTNTLSYVLLCHFHLQLPDNRHKWHTHTNPPPVTSVVEPSLPQASNPIRQQCHDKWGTVHLRPEPIIAPQPRSPIKPLSQQPPVGKALNPSPTLPLWTPPVQEEGANRLRPTPPNKQQWLTVGLEPGFSGPKPHRAKPLQQPCI